MKETPGVATANEIASAENACYQHILQAKKS